jgi:thiol:disulfide interchange protein DsbD
MTKTSQIALPVAATPATTASPATISPPEANRDPVTTPPAGESASTTVTPNWSNGEEVDNFLKAEEAFVFSVESPADRSHLILRWNLAEGYYLYRDKFKFTLGNGGQLGTPQFPAGTFRKDPVFGNVEIYLQSPLIIPVPLDAQGRETVLLNVEYQGCALAGLCYPPTHQSVEIAVGKGVVESEEDRIAKLFSQTSVWYMIMAFFGFGLLLSLTPCVYPMIPILSSIIVGQGWQISTSKAFLMSSVYVIAASCTYAVAGVLTGLLGENLQATFQSPWILGSFALIFVALAFSMFGFYELQLPNALQTRLSTLSSQQRGGTLTGVAIMGALSALIVGPCVAAPLAGALIYIGQTGDALLGGLALFAMGMGMGVPLLVIGTYAGHFLPRKGQWMEVIQAIFGVLLLAVAIWMIARFLPGQVTMLLWASLLIISAVYMGALDVLSAGVSGWRKLWKGIGILLLIYGILLMVGAARGNLNVLQPLETPGISGTPTVTPITSHLPFKAIKGVTELEREIAAARVQGKPVLLDFYADWCISCKEMEQFTLTETGVQKLLANLVLLRADVTANDDQDKALYKQFGIYGPPAILFFSAKTGQEQRAYRVVGFLPADKFRKQLELVLREGA